MQISRRATLAYASALTAVSATSARATVGPQAESIGRSQLVQHLVVHPDEAGGRIVCAYLSLPAPDTAWRTSTTLDETALHEANGTWHRRGYGVRRISAFQTRDGVRYAAIWQLGRTAPVHVQTGMDLATFRATAERLARQDLAISQLDAAGTDAGARFSAIWEAAADNQQKAFADLTEADFARHVADGLAPRLVAGYATGSGARFAAAFGAASGAQADLTLPASDYSSRARAMNAAGFALRDTSGYVVGGQPFVTAVWEKT